jgi:hypothetical protein
MAAKTKPGPVLNEYRIDKQPKKGIIRFFQFVPQRHIASVIVDRAGVLVELNEHLIRENRFRLEPIDLERLLNTLEAAKEAHRVVTSS